MEEAPTSPPRLRAQTEGATLRGRPRLRLEEIAEHRVVKSGVRVPRRRWAAEVCELPPLPKRPNGSPMLLGSAQSFFKRLLSQQLELQTSLPSDVSAAQRDIRHLCLEHLLTIRDDAADFKTHSQSHEAHNSFLNMIDQRLRELCCSKFMDPKQLDEVPAEDKQRLGHIVLLVQGAAAVLAGQEPEAASFAVSSGRVPRQWLLRSPIAPWRACWLRLPSEEETDTLESASTTPSSSSSLHRPLAGGLELRLLGDEDLEHLHSHEEVAVVWDRPTSSHLVSIVSGTSGGRGLGWEIAVAAPESSLMEELQAMEKGSSANLVGVGGSAGINSPLGQELVEVLERRKTAPALRPSLVPPLPAAPRG